MSSSSHSDSDSDREPNSHGARVFWGNVKTPERSRSIFINPPKTVVKVNKQRGSVQRTGDGATDGTAEGLDTNTSVFASGRSTEPAVTPAHSGVVLYPTHLHKDLDTEAQACPVASDLALTDIPPSVRHDTNSEPPELSTRSPMAMLKAQPSDPCSEREARDVAILPSPPNHTLSDNFSCIEARDLQDGQTAARSKSLSPTSMLLKGATHAPPASQLPDLISFDMTMPIRLPSIDQTRDSPRHPDTETNQVTSSSPYAMIDELLTISPRQTKPQFSPDAPSQGHLRSPEPRPVESIMLPFSPSSSSNDHTTDPQSSGQSSTPLSSHADQPISTCETSLHAQDAPTGNSQDTVATTMVAVIDPDDPPGAQTNDAGMPSLRHTDSVPPHSPGAETRKHTILETGYGNANAGGAGSSPGESSAITSNKPNEGHKHSNEVTDRAIKKKRRAKAREEHRRPLLMSLSPTSTDVLNLLASPRQSDRSSPPRALGKSVFETISANAPLPPNTPATTHAGPSTPARRVPIPAGSPRRSDGPPPYLSRPNPVHLDDPHRTPARRVPASTPNSTFQIQPRPLSLESPNRTPARRVAASPPTKHLGKPIIPSTQSSQWDGSPLASSPASTSKCASGPSPLKDDGRLKGNDRVHLPTVSRVPKPLPFPIAQKPPRSEQPSVDSADLSLATGANSPSKPASSSSLRQPSPISANKLGRLRVQPYSRPKHLHSRLPKPSSSRLPTPAAGLGHANRNLSQSKVSAQSAVPTRIPSPVKRQTPSVDVPEPASASPSVAAAVTGGPSESSIHRRKRPRFATECDDADEPPAKRPAIVVRRVTKGMFTKKVSTDLAIAGPTSHGETSPAPSSQSQQATPASDYLSKTIESSNAEIDAPTILEPTSPPRVDSSTANTETTPMVIMLSREPTLEDMPAPTPPVTDPGRPFATTTEPGSEPRRTTRTRKPSSVPNTRREPLPLTRTTSMVQRGTSSSKATKSLTHALDTAGIMMNQRQLQAITQANTVRNQIYFAELQRQVVRKDGPRPASPTTKVRTIIEKAKEAKAKGREARADRRRRQRGQGGSASAHSEDDSTDFKDASSSPPRDAIIRFSEKHARGPGDEEDYETPERAPKPSRLDPNKVSKNVKWDRGLAQYMSELATEATGKKREATATEGNKKGCLVRDPKTPRLDPLGNVPDAKIPLDDLGRERVVVTRFIYDDDDDTEATRAAKKKKT